MIKFHINPKLTNVKLGCTILIFDISITYFTGENYIRLWRNKRLLSILIGI